MENQTDKQADVISVATIEPESSEFTTKDKLLVGFVVFLAIAGIVATIYNLVNGFISIIPSGSNVGGGMECDSGSSDTDCSDGMTGDNTEAEGTRNGADMSFCGCNEMSNRERNEARQTIALLKNKGDFKQAKQVEESVREAIRTGRGGIGRKAYIYAKR